MNFFYTHYICKDVKHFLWIFGNSFISNIENIWKYIKMTPELAIFVMLFHSDMFFSDPLIMLFMLLQNLSLVFFDTKSSSKVCTSFICCLFFAVFFLVIALCHLGAVTGMYFLIRLNPRKIYHWTTSSITLTNCLTHSNLLHIVSHRNLYWDVGSILYHLKIHFDSV